MKDFVIVVPNPMLHCCFRIMRQVCRLCTDSDPRERLHPNSQSDMFVTT
jgi:hypothetical protein